MLIGYMRVSKHDSSKTVDLQRDALIAVSVKPERIYRNLASGEKEAR
jgi:DNA invertase Pin-like site-specific DNA recombinase